MDSPHAGDPAVDTGLYVGLDLGTSGCRGVVIDERGEVRASHAVDLPAPQRAGPRSEQDPAHWWQATVDVLETLVTRVPRERVRALAVDGTSATLLITDAAGDPLGPALMYNDARAIGAAARITALAPPESGAHGPSSALAKLLWLQEHADLTRACHALHQADWIAGRLRGIYDTSDENNALKLGYDATARAWPAWLDDLGVRRGLLPRVVPVGTVLGPVGTAVAAQLGLPSTTRIIAGTTDSIAALLASGARQVGEAVTSLGSTLVLKVISVHPVSAPQYGVYSHRLGARWLAGGASNTGGAVLLRYFTREQLHAMTPHLQPDTPTGTDYYPLPAQGERFPICDPALPPRMTPRPTDDVQYFQGLLEGMARIEHLGYELLARCGAPYPQQVYTAGGGSANPAWSRIRARELGVPVLTAYHQDAAYGSALIASGRL